MVEDDPEDVMIAKQAFKDGKIIINVKVYETTDLFIDEMDDIQSCDMPDLIMLDLNLPGTDGRELLTKIKQSDKWKNTPIIVLTTSKSEEDIISSYKLHCNSYIIKPIDPLQFLNIARSIDGFWFHAVKLEQQATT